MAAATGPLLTVTYTAEPDTLYAFSDDGERRLFGRDDTRCQIVIWSAINGHELSRVAGVIWRMDDELWVRNLSTRHELYLQAASKPAEPPLPPRVEGGVDRGPARSIPPGLTFMRAPGGCELLVRQIHSIIAIPSLDEADGATFRAPPVPAHLRAVAAALCEPLLRGSQLPATHAQVTERAATGSLRRTRNLVAALCALYADEVPLLRSRVAERLRRESEQLGIGVPPKLRAGGVWTYDQEPDDADDESARRRALALPDYFEVAHLLVRRHLVTTADLDTALPIATEEPR